MKLSEVKALDGYDHVNNYYAGDRDCSSVFTSDLLSDVVANAEDGSVLITIQAHKNTIAVASLVGIAAIVFCSGRKADEATIRAADDENITLFATADNQFGASCKLGKVLEDLNRK